MNIKEEIIWEHEYMKSVCNSNYPEIIKLICIQESEKRILNLLTKDL